MKVLLGAGPSGSFTKWLWWLLIEMLLRTVLHTWSQEEKAALREANAQREMASVVF
jgi:hypothetical protein